MPIKESAPEQNDVQSRALAKGLLILDYLAEKRKPLSLTDLAAAVSLGKPSTLRILSTLQVSGFLIRDENDHYILDREWPRPSMQSWLRRLNSAALPEMRRLNVDLAETVTLASMFEDHLRVLDVLDSPQVIRMANYKGRLLPPYASSLGKAITAHQSPQQVAVLLQIFGSYKFTEKTVTDPRAVKEDLERVRQIGYSVDDEETVLGGICFGAPIFAADGSVSAAISVSQPKPRLTAELRKTLPGMLMEAAQRISTALGYKRRRS
jgi:IclR family acetate operon transcriptional repressor